MKIKHFTDIEASNPFSGLGDAKNLSMRLLIGAEDGAPNFNMRFLEFGPEGQTHFHDHKWEHEIFVFEGEGAVVLEDGEVPFKKGDAVFIGEWEKHRIKNTGTQTLKLICCIPQPEK